ncbi:MAG: hypothetical protein GY805_00705 [Chloroflexi bacterium]|nr:hypothetical protein [Chloroflexota bacterium]
MQQSLFDFSDNGRSRTGYRLHTLELYNWGTFDKQIWRIQPGGDTALLTGENGSGKSTLVDALLTLLVPNIKRNYNQAAATGKRERNEASYVRGAYGRLQSGEGYNAHIQYLRDKDKYSVLLAHFHNDGYQQDITLVQIFWHTDSLKKFHVVATRALAIQDDFIGFETIKELKKRLRGMKGVTVEDQFNRYSRQFRKLFGLRSDKALDLFNQTVTIKEIGQLNDFVRQHMLEKTDAQEKIGQLQEHYENLMLAYRAMQKAEHQLALLRPLTAEARKYEAAQTEIDVLRGCQEAIPIYFAGRKWKLLQTAVSSAQQDLAAAQAQFNQLDEQLSRLRQQDTDLQIAISNDETGQRLRELERDIRHTRQNQQRKQDDARRYDQIARALNLSSYDDEAAFAANRQQADKLAAKIQQQAETAAEQLRQAQIAENELIQERDATQQELDSLHGRSSQIPYTNLRIRAQILDALTIAEADVPFVGELLRVKENERDWEGAIERLLHNLGLRLLVPERHYGRFSHYVNENHLDGRLIFHRIPENGDYRAHQPDNPRALFHKLDIKPDTPYYDWLENELIARYDYTCAENMTQVNRARRAITQTGLSKTGGHRYEKDDRRRLTDRRNYILGWHNQDKIHALQDELTSLQKRLQQEKNRINQAKAVQRQTRQQQDQLNNLLAFADFAQLDWRRDAAHAQQLESQKKRLEQSSDRLQQLQTELAQIQTQISAISQKRSDQSRIVSQLEYQIAAHQKEISRAKVDVREADDEAMKQYAPRIKEQVTVPIDLENVDRLWRDVLTHFRQASDSEQRRASAIMGRLLKMMQEYKDAYPAETADFDAAVASIPEFDRELARIEHDDLPQYTTRFRRMRDEKVLEAIALFHADLHKYVEEIEESIANLNQSLRTIDYTPDTYIELQTENSRVPEIREFRQMLKDCLVDVGRQRTEAAYEASFAKVRDLIARFKDDPRWTARVTDVRYWLSFAAIERYRADDSEKHYYSDSSGKSGGQKVKLAYTILASAIAFQFGLERGQSKSRSFRFVVVDEAFSRSDENNSRYAMQLFKELDLQLLVVTPMTGIHIVEPYIHACHFVWNNSEGSNSQIHTMSIQQFRDERMNHEETKNTKG